MKTPWLRLLAGGGVIAACVSAGCSGKDAAGNAETAATERAALLVGAGDVVQVRTVRLESGVNFTGELNPLQVTDVVARFDGDIQQVLVREGQAVRQGQSLAVYAPRDVDDALQAAQAELLAASATLVAAENAQRRARRLLEAGAAAPSDLETAESARAAAQARVRAAEAASNHADEDSRKLAVPAPIAGSVSRLLVHDGSRTAVGDPLMTIVDTRTLELSATVASEALAGVQPGALLRFRVDAYPDESFAGAVDRVNPTTEPGTRQLRIYTRIPNPSGKLVGGLYVSGRVVTSTREAALAAPVGALRTEGSGHVVYRLRGGRAERVEVRLGLLDEAAGMAELVGELAAGDSLLTGVLPGIRDAVQVRVLDATSQR